ncbi:MAG: hypothetical protein NT001_03210 [Candidatus Woesearchaeota archaeon]|nr:hypothetical protein [Candidatus Woesearchaeota archaeon]
MERNDDTIEQKLKSIVMGNVLARRMRPNVMYQVYLDNGKSADETDPGPYFEGFTLKEKEGIHYLIEVREVKKEPDERCDVIVYTVDPVDEFVEEIYSRSFSGTNMPKSDATGIFREFRDSNDITKTLDKYRKLSENEGRR